MTLLDLLPWLNLLLFPVLGAMLYAATQLTKIETWMTEHDKLDKVRFDEIERRLANVESALINVRKRYSDD